MSVVCKVTKPAPIISIMILARDAVVPKEASRSIDGRLIGAGLISMAVHAAGDEETPTLTSSFPRR